MKTLAAATFAGIALASTPSLAADLFGPAPAPMSFPAENSPATEVGSNWYLRGDIGMGIDPAAVFSMAGVSTPAPGIGVLPFSNSIGSANDRDDLSLDLGFGYRYNNWLRFEGTYEFRMGPVGKNNNTVICPYGLTASPAAPAVPTGYLYDTTNTCNGALDLMQRNSTVLAAAYLDLGTYWGVTPYLGAGGGMNANITSGSVAYTTTVGGTPYGANLSPGTAPAVWVNAAGTPISPQPNIPFSQQNWNRSVGSVKYTPAWALMAGFGIQMSPSATLDIGYRYLNAGLITTPVTSQIGSSVKQLDSSQEIRIGIRYMAD